MIDDTAVGVEVISGTEMVYLAARSRRVLNWSAIEAGAVAGPARGVAAVEIDAEDRAFLETGSGPLSTPGSPDPSTGQMCPRLHRGRSTHPRRDPTT
jgi:hypothetical protein